MFPAVMMTISLVERALLVKMFYENKENASIRRIKKLQRGSMCSKCIQAMFVRFEEAVNLSHQ